MSSILLIDDGPIQIGTRKAVLVRAGFEVFAAADASTALSLVRSESGRWDLIITDHVMPNIPGSDFVRQLRKWDADIPVIVISGLPEAVEEYSELNVHFRYKPCPPRELIELARSLTSRKTLSAAV